MALFVVPYQRAKFVEWHVPAAAKNGRDFHNLLRHLYKRVDQIIRPPTVELSTPQIDFGEIYNRMRGRSKRL